MPPTWILRDLPGVAELEERYQATLLHRSPMWAPGRKSLLTDLYQQIKVLFGWDVPAAVWSAEDLDLVLGVPDEVDLDVYLTLDWDMSDGAGQPLGLARHFAIPIMAAAQGRASFPTPNGIRERSTVDAEAWGASLEDEARRFRSRRRDVPKKPDKGKGRDDRR